VARNSAEAEETTKVGEVEGAKLDPIGMVKRSLTRPDGSTVIVEVPVYPPFQLADRASARKPARSRSAPSLKRKRSGPSREESPSDE
jgi:bifunctional pyridoxal-dependent enzyme with beta-cystathionase and maltose regulon repressor activities